MIAVNGRKIVAAPTKIVSFTTEGGKLKMSFGNGETFTISPDELSPEIRAEAVLHGLKQKLGDAGAIPRNTETGLSAAPEEKYDAIREVMRRITSPEGKWNKTREGEQKGGGLLTLALMRVFGKDRVETESRIAAMSKEQCAAMHTIPKVMEALAAIAAERAKVSEVDTNALLADWE